MPGKVNTLLCGSVIACSHFAVPAAHFKLTTHLKENKQKIHLLLVPWGRVGAVQGEVGCSTLLALGPASYANKMQPLKSWRMQQVKGMCEIIAFRVHFRSKQLWLDCYIIVWLIQQDNLSSL